MTRAAIVETLAKDFSTDAEAMRGVLEMLDAGLSATYIGRFRRGDSKLTESVVRRLQRRRDELEELDRRRGTILRMLTGKSDKDEPLVDDGSFPEIRGCMDRFELEDLFLPHRRPEPEVQLALDRGLGGLADRIVAPSEKAVAAEKQPAPEKQDTPKEQAAAPAPTVEVEPAEPATADAKAKADAAAAAPSGGPDPEDAPTKDVEDDNADDNQEDSSAPTEKPATAPAASAEVTSAESSEAAAPDAEGGARPKRKRKKKSRSATPDVAHLMAELPGLKESVEVTPGLARLCREFVAPDRGVHTEEEALAGALRILSDRLGRDPGVRRTIRKALRKHGVLALRATGEDGRSSRHKALFNTNEPVRTLQGKKLLRIRQAQKDRAITAALHLDPAHVLPRVREALGTRIDPEFQPLVDHVAARALVRRLLPMIEADVRLELKERADEEALRFLSQHLRQILLAPVAGPRPIAGVATNAKRDWILVPLDAAGEPISGEVKIETKDKDEISLAEELGNALRDTGVYSLAIASGKGSLAELPKLRACIRLLGAEAAVFVVNDAGLASYANSEIARKELPDHGIPARTAISIGRRYQDALLEIIKLDPRHLGLGMETGLVSKANLRRTLRDTVESAVALVGCDVNDAPERLLRHLPGLDAETVTKLVARRAEQPFQSREDLRASGILSEAQWVSAAACLRVRGSDEPLDRTSLHPDQYADARRLIEAVGGTVEDVLGRRGATKGLRRGDFGIEESLWRDLIREISFPGRDPRLRLFPPSLLPPDTDLATLTKGQVVEGIVTSVSGFGAFVDLGVPREGMIHISEASNRYVRDAREAISIGQVVRAKILDPGGPRITLTLKQVPPVERKRPERRPAGGRRRERDGGGAKGWPEVTRPVRAAQTRRDGLAGSSSGKPGRGGGRKKEGGFGGGPSRGGGGGMGGGGRRGGRGKSEDYDADAVRKAGKTSVKFNPFANFFKKDEDGAEGGD